MAFVNNIPDRLHHLMVTVPLQAAFEDAGHEFIDVRVDELDTSFSPRGPLVLWRGESLECDVVFARVLQASSSDSLKVYGLTTAGFVVVNDPAKAHAAGDKWLCGLALANAGLPVIPTRLVSPSFNEDLRGEFEFPLVCKPVHGIGDERAVRVDTPEQFAIVAASFAPNAFLAQPFIPAAAFGDVRVLVCAGAAVAAVRRSPAAGDFRASVSTGGSACWAVLQREWARLAEAVVAVSGLTIAGVDLAVGEDGLWVVDINPSPILALHNEDPNDVNRAVADAVVAAADSP